MLDLAKILDGIENKTELVEKINAEIGREFVPRSEFNSKNEELKKTTAAIAERDKQIEQLSTVTGDKDALTAEINRLKAENKDTAKQHAADMRKIRIDQAIEREIAGIAKPDAIDLIPKLINMDAIIENSDGSLLGLTEQIGNLKTNRKSLFNDESTETKPQFAKGQAAQVKPALTREQITAISDPVARRAAIAENITLFK